MGAVVRWVQDKLAPAKAFFGFDELHGINRDSRSRRRGWTNAQALAYAINRLQAMLSASRNGSRAMASHSKIHKFTNYNSVRFRVFTMVPTNTRDLRLVSEGPMHRSKFCCVLRAKHDSNPKLRNLTPFHEWILFNE